MFLCIKTLKKISLLSVYLYVQMFLFLELAVSVPWCMLCWVLLHHSWWFCWESLLRAETSTSTQLTGCISMHFLLHWLHQLTLVSPKILASEVRNWKWQYFIPTISWMVYAKQPFYHCPQNDLLNVLIILLLFLHQCNQILCFEKSTSNHIPIVLINFFPLSSVGFPWLALKRNKTEWARLCLNANPVGAGLLCQHSPQPVIWNHH